MVAIVTPQTLIRNLLDRPVWILRFSLASRHILLTLMSRLEQRGRLFF